MDNPEKLATHVTQDQKKTPKNLTQCALDTIIRKQAQITLIRHQPSYKQMEVETNRTLLVCGNHNTEPKT
jgi:hypothetical protein